MRDRVRFWWCEWSIYGMMALFVAVFVWLIFRQYATFDTRAADLDRFLQGMWNTLHGRFLYANIEERSIISGHFTPMFAILAPLLYIWEDPRVFSVVQTIGLAVAGFFLWLIVRRKYPMLAPFFALAFFLNPSLHQVAVLELRRITLAVPFIAMALYGLASHQRKWLLAGVLLGLLCKENVAFPVIMMGIYLVVVERDWKWGAGLVALGIAWILMVLLVVNPMLDPKAVNAESRIDVYRGFNYYATWGSTPSEILLGMAKRPFAVVQRLFDAAALGGLWRLLAPMGLVLPLLAPTWAVLCLPTIGYMLLGGYEPMHSLQDWYVASIVPVLFAAIGVGITRRPYRQAQWLVGILLATTVWGYLAYSYAPGGGRYLPVRYEIIPHHETAAAMVDLVPPEARVAAQSAYTPHLALRNTIYMYPWIPTGAAPMDYILVDRNLKSFPWGEVARNDAINNLIADPTYVIAQEADGIFLMAPNGAPLPALAVGAVAEDAILLERAEIALTDARGFFQNSTTLPLHLAPGQTVRVTLYWEALAQPKADRTVSVRLATSDGALAAQQDMMPSNGARPTSWWQPGWRIRDVYYLTVPAQAAPGAASLDVLLYDSYSQERVPFDQGEVLHLAEAVIASD